MSDIFRKSVLNRLPALPPTRAPWASPEDAEEDEDLEELEDDPVGDLGSGPSRPTRSSRNDYSPISAATYFSQALLVSPPSYPVEFRAYYSPSTKADRGALLVCHHGAGSSGTTFAAMAKEVKDLSGGELGVLSFDARGHGKTKTDPTSEELILSFKHLQEDFIALLSHIFPEPSNTPDLILLGHSMGASPIISSAPILQQKGYKVVGVVVLDVVEGTAVEALPLMKSILAQRPLKFASVEAAIGWHLDAGAVRNATSARISVPALVVPTGEPAGDLKWRTDLLGTSAYWEEWYLHLSSFFLAARSARLLILAGQERLDRELMVGQMQGKFQLEVLPDVGHYLHEDKPQKVASVLVDFWKRNTTVIRLPPKIGSPAVPQSVKLVGDS